MFHWWETNLVLHIIRTTVIFKLFHMQPNKKMQFKPATQVVQELCFQGCGALEVTAPSLQEKQTRKRTKKCLLFWNFSPMEILV